MDKKLFEALRKEVKECGTFAKKQHLHVKRINPS